MRCSWPSTPAVYAQQDWPMNRLRTPATTAMRGILFAHIAHIPLAAGLGRRTRAQSVSTTRRGCARVLERVGPLR